MDTSEDSSANRIYSWTIRSLYLVAIAMNVYFLLESMKETPEGRLLLDRLRATRDGVTAPSRLKKKQRLEENRVVLEAMLVLDREGK